MSKQKPFAKLFNLKGGAQVLVYLCANEKDDKLRKVVQRTNLRSCDVEVNPSFPSKAARDYFDDYTEADAQRFRDNAQKLFDQPED